MAYDLGFLGGGQLARMSIQAAQRMGLSCLSLDSSPDTPAAGLAPSVVGSIRTVEDLTKIFSQCAKVTLENEFVPAEAIRAAMTATGFDPENLVPRVEALANIQDKLRQRELLIQEGVASPKAVAIETVQDLGRFGWPAVLKSRFGGYDGKGTVIAKNLESVADEGFWREGWLVEEYVPFSQELAVMVETDGTFYRAFPTVVSRQTANVCDVTYPSSRDASDLAVSAVKAVAPGSPGLFGVELFEHKDGTMSVNEIAPRPHNSGHYTLDWGASSQFESHVRIVMGFPWRSLQPNVPTAMANLLGQEGGNDLHAAIAAALAEGDVAVHWYGKKENKPGRKMGHLNARASSAGSALELAERARSAFYSAWQKGGGSTN